MSTQQTEVWIRGLVAAFVSGGAGAVTGAFTASLLAPAEFNLNGKALHMVELMLTMFFVNGIMGMFAYLKQSPIPPVVEAAPETKSMSAGAGK